MPSTTHDHDAQWRAAKRAAARRFHPDRGGNVDDYLRELEAVDRRFNKPVASESRGRVYIVARATLPRRIVGSAVRLSRKLVKRKRYITLD